jgi:hypothetical protein
MTCNSNYPSDPLKRCTLIITQKYQLQYWEKKKKKIVSCKMKQLIFGNHIPHSI